MSFPVKIVWRREYVGAGPTLVAHHTLTARSYRAARATCRIIEGREGTDARGFRYVDRCATVVH